MKKATVIIETAVALSQLAKKQLEHVLVSVHPKAMFEYRIDKKLLGGMRVTIDDWRFDGTLRTRLQRLHDALIG